MMGLKTRNQLPRADVPRNLLESVFPSLPASHFTRVGLFSSRSATFIIALLERLRFSVYAKRKFVPRDYVFPLIVVNC